MQITEEFWASLVAFHGHSCPGLAKGARMACEAARVLNFTGRSSDEELVCISETDACCVDAAQFLLGCTLGKGNLILKLRGKTAMTVYRRDSGQAVRLLWKENSGLPMGREERISFILKAPAETLLSATEVADPELAQAMMSPSFACATCGELTSEAMMRPWQNALHCLDCVPSHPRILP